MVNRYLSHLLGKWVHGIKAMFLAFRWLEKNNKIGTEGFLWEESWRPLNYCLVTYDFKLQSRWVPLKYGRWHTGPLQLNPHPTAPLTPHLGSFTFKLGPLYSTIYSIRIFYLAKPLPRETFTFHCKPNSCNLYLSLFELVI